MRLFNYGKTITFLVSIMLFWGCGQSEKKNLKPKAQSISTQPDQEPQLKDAPDFSLETRIGDTFKLSNHEGKIIVLNIWATWCAPCRKEIPDFMELYEELKNQGVLFAGVSVDKEGWSKVRPFAKKLEINYPTMVDDGQINRKYGPIRAIPTTFIINKKGKVEYVAQGMLTKKRLKPVLTKLAQR